MEIYQMRSFVVLAEHLHFGRAARALHVSQPALTKQIQRLEDELGVVLFERGTGATKLSEVGNQWLPVVREALERVEAAVDFARKAGGGEIGQLRVGFGFHTLELVPAMVARLRASSPLLRISLRDMSTAEQAAALAADQLDIGFMRMPVAEPKRYQIRPVIQDRLALVTPEGWGDGKVGLADLRSQPFVSISRARSPGFCDHVLDLCAAHGFHPRIVQEVFEFSTAVAMVRAGMGVTVIPQSLWTSRLSGVTRHEIPDRRARWKVAAVWRKGDTNPVLAAFVRLLPAE